MTESLNVIALISGGKDSFFSILHCLQNGHKVVALANLYPPGVGGESTDGADEDDEHDLNSFMYQTVGHTVIPLYEKALRIPLYRQPIIGSAIQTAVSYSPVNKLADGPTSKSDVESSELGNTEDETESLVPLLKRIIAEHPTANAISTGAILSTYQRTRVESVALRLGLTPLGLLWKYPILPPGTQTSLLTDMESVGLDARIIKVASGGLDESFLWQNVASENVMRRVERSMERFGTDGDGAVIGEGGEFETLVIDGPDSLFKGRIEIQEEDRRVVREGGGAAWLRILKARVVMKTTGGATKEACRVPSLLSPRFSNVLEVLESDQKVDSPPEPTKSYTGASISEIQSHVPKNQEGLLHWTVTLEETTQTLSIAEEASSLVAEIRRRLINSFLQPSDIISTMIVLRSMADFAAINKIYGSLFTAPNPPARVTISSGSLLPTPTNLTIHLTLHATPHPPPQSPHKALHVQSRSYWAPANIGPYSQAISIPSATATSNIRTVSVAGQIPLIPHIMALPPGSNLESFKLQTVLSLQHLWRIGEDMDVGWWTSAVAYLPRGADAQRAVLAGRAWGLLHERGSEEEDDEDGGERDLWEEKHLAGMEQRGGGVTRRELPDWEVLKGQTGAPPFWAAEVEELPRGAGIEWHAHVGVVGGPVEVRLIREEGWTVHQCGFGGRLHSVLVVDYSTSSSDVIDALAKGLKGLGMEGGSDFTEYLSYLDVSIEGLQESRTYHGAVPCRRLWDVSGRSIALVLLFNT